MLRLNPTNEEAHANPSLALEQTGDASSDIAEERETPPANPDNAVTHVNLGVALGKKGDWDGEIREERAALRLDPNNDAAHANLGVALGNKGDWDGEIREERAALRLNPSNDKAHVNLGVALGNKGDWDGEISEEHAALRLNPDNDHAHQNLGVALAEKGDWEGATAEFREALRLNPKNEAAHAGLDLALGRKGPAPPADPDHPPRIWLDTSDRLYIVVSTIKSMADGRFEFHGILLLPLAQPGPVALDRGTEVIGIGTRKQSQISLTVTDMVVQEARYTLKNGSGAMNAQTPGAGGGVHFERSQVLDMWPLDSAFYDRVSEQTGQPGPQK